MRVRHILLTTSLLVLFSFAAACGNSSSSGEDTAERSSDDPQSFEDIDFRSPIGEFLGIDYGASEDREAEFAEMEREAGRLTAQCMIDKGFEYTPPDTSSFVSFGGPDEELPYFSDEWVEKYGFGITTQRFPQSQVGDLVGFPDGNFDRGGEFVDPNQEYLESLSDAEREAYDEALWGIPPDFGPGGPSEEQMQEFEPTGCQNEAFEQAYGELNGAREQAFFEAYQDDLIALEERINADARVVEFHERVGSCVADAGHEYSSSFEDLAMRFESRLGEVQPSAFGPGDPFEEAGLDPDEMTEDELNDFFDELNRISPEGLAILAELQAEEIELARVVVGCGGGPLNEQILLSEVRVEYEQDFLDSNAADLEQFGA